MSNDLRRRVAVVGATGVAGQQFLVSLDGHPWFELVALAASERSAGKPYRAAITDASGHVRWACEEPLPAAFAERPVIDARELNGSEVAESFPAPLEFVQLPDQSDQVVPECEFGQWTKDLIHNSTYKYPYRHPIARIMDIYGYFSRHLLVEVLCSYKLLFCMELNHLYVALAGPYPPVLEASS